MEANELRIGNYVVYGEDGTLFEVGKISTKGFIVTNEDETTWIESEYFEPVQLTEDWILKFGIKNIWIFEIFGDNERGFHISSDCGQWIMIEYVHQLQNLYFALTQRELTLS